MVRRTTLSATINVLMLGAALAGPQEECVQVRDPWRAIAACSQILREEPGQAVLHYRRGLAFAATKDHLAAIEDFSRAIESDPAYAEAYNVRGIAYRETKDYARAIADQTRAIEINPGFARAYSD